MKVLKLVIVSIYFFISCTVDGKTASAPNEKDSLTIEKIGGINWVFIKVTDPEGNETAKAYTMNGIELDQYLFINKEITSVDVADTIQSGYEANIDDGCNRGSGLCSIHDSKISFTGMMTTLIHCDFYNDPNYFNLEGIAWYTWEIELSDDNKRLILKNATSKRADDANDAQSLLGYSVVLERKATQ